MEIFSVWDRVLLIVWDFLVQRCSHCLLAMRGVVWHLVGGRLDFGRFWDLDHLILVWNVVWNRVVWLLDW